MPTSSSGRISPSSFHASSQRRPLWSALLAGLLLLGTPAIAGTPKKKQPAPAKSKEEPSQKSEAQVAYADAAALLRAKQYAEAHLLAKRCLEADPKFADCHMVRGASLAGLKKWDEAAEAYRTFLSLAPDHEMAAKVRATLENYEKTRSR